MLAILWLRVFGRTGRLDLDWQTKTDEAYLDIRDGLRRRREMMWQGNAFCSEIWFFDTLL